MRFYQANKQTNFFLFLFLFFQYNINSEGNKKKHKMLQEKNSSINNLEKEYDVLLSQIIRNKFLSIFIQQLKDV